MKFKTSIAVALALCIPLALTNAFGAGTASSGAVMSICEGLDANGDHLISKDEAKKSAEVSVFLSKKKNSDGNITVTECEDYMTEVGAGKKSN